MISNHSDRAHIRVGVLTLENTHLMPSNPMIFETFTTSDDECTALYSIMNIDSDNHFKAKKMAKSVVKNILGNKTKHLKTSSSPDLQDIPGSLNNVSHSNP